MNKFGLSLEPIGYTEQEFEQVTNQGNSFINEVIATGSTIYSHQI